MNQEEFEQLVKDESKNISEERNQYDLDYHTKGGLKIFEKLSNFFTILGFISLALIFFTEVTLIQATCFFIIGYTLMPTDGDRYQAMIKGLAEDLAHVRLNTTILSKKLLKK